MNTPPLSFFLETTGHRVDRHGPLWEKPLPLTLKPAAAASHVNGPVGPSYGDYFNAVSDFLTDNGCRRLRRVLTREFFEEAPIERIRVFLIKHGEFYHPARIELDVGARRHCFILNVAVSEAGMAAIDEEYRCLNRLSGHPKGGRIPRAYALGAVSSANRPNMKMWLGEWFEDYHEFHWSRNSGRQAPTLVIWNPKAPPRCLNRRQTGQIFIQAAALLTDFFDLNTFQQIHPWHHAAGDFVVRQKGDAVDVRLITVRGYPSLLSDAPPESESGPDAGLILQLLLLFLVRLSLRMRVDRFDGVGKLLWADETVVNATVTGFLAALARKPPSLGLPETPLICFDYFFSRCSEADLHEITREVAAACPDGHPEKTLLSQNASAHAAQLFTALSRLLNARD